MPSIYLKQTSGSYGTVNVAEDSYSPSNLFKKYKHTLTPPETGKIYIYKGKKNWSGSFIITLDNSHRSAKLQEVYVYFNKYDTVHEYPLVFVLKFENGVPSAENKYYTRSKFKDKLTNGGESVGISQLTRYEDDNSILKTLLEENDKLTELLTYDIGRRSGEESDTPDGQYNDDKIKVKEDSVTEPTLSNNGFKRYKHTPSNGGLDKKACVIYDGNLLMQKNGTEEVKGIQDQPYKCIRVYMGEKAKKESIVNGKKQIEVPLLIELNKTSGSDQPDYYVHKRKPDGGREYYWEKLPGNGGTTLKDLLVDMGFGMTNGQPGYKELKQLLTKASVNGVDSDQSDLSTKLNGLKGKQLQTMLKQQVGNGGSANPTLLVLLLRQIEFDLLDSVIVLLEKRESDRQYTDGDVSGVILKLEPKREINRVKMNNGGDKNITVSDKTEQKGTCVQNYKYKVYEHNFSSLVQEEGQSGQSYFGIRFIMPSKDSDKYKQLSLYSSIGLQAEPQNLEYKYYQKNGEPGRNGDTNNQPKVYVWFYNGDDGTGKGDPRPLIICYGGNTYAPKDKETYFTEWAKVDLGNGQGSTDECGCNGQEPLPENNNKLLKELDRVVKFLNTVNLKAGTSGSSGTHKYNVHKFQNKDIQIKVDCSRVGDSSADSPEGTCSSSPNGKSCYKKFEHKPAGMQNGGATTNGSGFRLGAVEYIPNGYSGKPKGTLDYTTESEHKYDPLVAVSVFYYDKDTNYNDPLLIELEFKQNGSGGAGPKEYYKLQPNGNGGDGIRTWKLDTDAQNSMRDPRETQKQVNYLDGIRYSLKPVMKILIDKLSGYDLCLSTNPGGTGNTYSPQNGGKQIQVTDCTEGGCTALSEQNYKCYVHKVSEIKGNGSGTFEYNR